MNITYTEKQGTETLLWNVDKGGMPYAQIWTFPKAKGFIFNYHAKLLAGQYHAFKTLAAAKYFIETGDTAGAEAETA